MAQLYHPSKRPKRARGLRGCALAIFALGAWSFTAMAASFPTLPDNHENEVLHLVKSCYNKGPYSSKAEASTVADDVETQGYIATVAKAANGKGWMVKVCKK